MCIVHRTDSYPYSSTRYDSSKLGMEERLAPSVKQGGYAPSSVATLVSADFPVVDPSYRTSFLSPRLSSRSTSGRPPASSSACPARSPPPSSPVPLLVPGTASHIPPLVLYFLTPPFAPVYRPPVYINRINRDQSDRMLFETVHRSAMSPPTPTPPTARTASACSATALA